MRKQFLGLASVRLMATLMQAVSIVIIGRGVGLSSFGVFGIATSVAAVGSTLLDSGLSTYVARAQAMKRTAQVRGAVRLNGWTTLLGCAVAVGVPLLLNLDGSRMLWLVPLLLALVLEKSVETLLMVSVGDGEARPSTLSLIVRRGIALVGVLAGTWGGVSLLAAYSFAYLGGCVVARGLVALDLQRRLVMTVKPDSEMTVLRGALPFLLSNVAVQSRLLDVTVVGMIGGHAQAAIYSAGQRLSNPLMLVPQTLATVLMPHAVGMPPSVMRRVAWRLLLWSLAISVVALVALPVGGDVASLVLGDRYRASGVPLVLLMAALPIIGVTSQFGALLQARGEEAFVATNGVVTAIVTLAAIALGSSLGGADGAALGVIAGFLVKAAVLVWKMRSLLGVEEKHEVDGEMCVPSGGRSGS
jgi:O-antigen/teichoic acid export membrane protein